MTSAFLRGFRLPFESLGFLRRHPGLLRYVALPAAINLVVFSLLIGFAIGLFATRVIPLIPRGEAWYWGVLVYLLWLLALVASALLVFFGFTLVGNLIASPFNELLSERTEDQLRGRRREEPFRWRGFLGDAWRGLGVEARKSAALAGGMLLLLPLNLLPLVGSGLYALLAAGLTLYGVCLGYVGIVLTRKGEGFAAQHRFVMGRKPLMAGFGCGVLLLLAIPFLQLLCIPLAVIGATRLWCEAQAPDGGA